MNQIQSKLAIMFSSGAVWTVIALFAYNALNANISMVPAGWNDAVNLLLSLLAMYLHSAHVQSAAIMGSTKV